MGGWVVFLRIKIDLRISDCIRVCEYEWVCMNMHISLNHATYKTTCATQRHHSLPLTLGSICLLASRSNLFPAKAITMLGLPYVCVYEYAGS